MELTLWKTILIIIIICVIGDYIINPICKCILECYKVKHSVFKIEDEKPKDFQDVDYR